MYMDSSVTIVIVASLRSKCGSNRLENYTCCDMTAKSQGWWNKNGWPFSRQWHGKHISTATNIPAVIVQLWEVVFYVQSMLE
jgi:hypothetical protein